jgi:hypothetical protein
VHAKDKCSSLFVQSFIEDEEYFIVTMTGQRENVLLRGSRDKTTELLKHILMKAIN